MSLTVSEITALPVPTQTYSLRNALSDALGYAPLPNGTLLAPPDNALGWYFNQPSRPQNTILLYEAGCRMNDLAITASGWDCFVACTSVRVGPLATWTGPNASWTIQNCLVYPFLAAALAADELVEDPPGLLVKYGIEAEPDVNSTLSKNPHLEAWPIVNDCLRVALNLLASRETEPTLVNTTYWLEGKNLVLASLLWHHTSLPN